MDICFKYCAGNPTFVAVRWLATLISLFIAFSIYAQGTFLPLGGSDYNHVDRLDIQYHSVNPLLHTSHKPYSRLAIAQLSEGLYHSNIGFTAIQDYQLQHLMNNTSEWLDSTEFRSKDRLLKWFYTEPGSFYSVNTDDFVLRINPVAQLTVGQETDVSGINWVNTRGIDLRAYIAKKVGLYTYIGENQIIPTTYVFDRIYRDTLDAVPGEGFFKPYRERGVDHFTARGYVTVNAINHIDISLGHDKNFIGNGIRSLMLSDVSNNYFFLKLNTKVWRISYQNIYAELTNQYKRGADRLLDKKYGVFHHLNIAFTDWFHVGLFEGVIHNRSDHFELQYLNPIIFYRSIEQDLGSPDNAVIGLDAKVNLFDQTSFYGQLVLDEFNFSEFSQFDGWWGNKYAIQGGVKYIDVASVEHLDAQLEFNIARPYTYTHGNTSFTGLANYTHYNQELAHPLGANFREWIFKVNYQPLPKLNVQLHYFNMLTGTDTSGSNWGGNVFNSILRQGSGVFTVEQERNNVIGQGVRTLINLVDLRATYELRHNLNFDAQILYRDLNSAIDDFDESALYFGVSARYNIPFRNYHF